MHYDVRRDREGWTVFDRWTGQVVVLGDAAQIGLTWDEARKVIWSLRRRPGHDDRSILQ